MARHLRPDRTPGISHEAAEAAAPARSSRSLPEIQALYRVLAAGEQQLAAALRQIEVLRRQEALLKKKVALLERSVAKARRFAHHDDLTGLPTRRLLFDRFNQAVARAKRQHHQVVLVFLDLDGFKRINDALGHPAGDQLLQQVAARLTHCIRTSDTACRYGGDEFAVLLPDFENHECAFAAGEKIRAQLVLPYVIDHSAIHITTSVGVAAYPADGSSYHDLIQASDRAMYRDKTRSAAPPSILDYTDLVKQEWSQTMS